MPGRRLPESDARFTGARTRWTAGALALGVAASAAAVALLPAGPASAKVPRADYHAGSDKAVFTVTGVEDSNCLISAGGNTVFIKPGDRIDFSTALAGVSLGGLNLQGGQVAGLNVRASIDGGSTFAVPAGRTVKVKNLSTGTHTLAWSARSVAVTVPAVTKTITGLLGKITHQTIPAHNITVPLSSSALKSGAKLSWAGKIHVTKSAPQCKIAVQTPRADVSLGPTHVTLPGQNVSVPGATLPTKVPGVPDLSPKTSSAPKKTKQTKSPTATPSAKYTPPQLTVPEMVVPRGDNANVYGGGGSGYDLGLNPDSGTGSQLTDGTTTPGGVSLNGTGSGGSSTTSVAPGGTGKTNTVDLASNDDKASSSMSGQLPVLLAILAVIALAMVAGTYARLYLLGRKN